MEPPGRWSVTIRARAKSPHNHTVFLKGGLGGLGGWVVVLGGVGAWSGS